MRCTKRLTGRKGECRTVTEEVISPLGKITWVCPRCSWVEKGLCWECGKQKEKRKLYCTSCAKKNSEISKQRHRDTDQYKQTSSSYFKKKLKEDEEFRKRKLENKRNWLKRNPHKKEEYKLSRIYRELGL